MLNTNQEFKFKFELLVIDLDMLMSFNRFKFIRQYLLSDV